MALGINLYPNLAVLFHYDAVSRYIFIGDRIVPVVQIRL